MELNGEVCWWLIRLSLGEVTFPDKTNAVQLIEQAIEEAQKPLLKNHHHPPPNPKHLHL